MNVDFEHEPVLLREVIRGLEPGPGGVYVDATVGGGGHALEIIKKIQPGGTLIGMDQDGEALLAAEKNLKEYASAFIPLRSNFYLLEKALRDIDIAPVDGILFDLGVSSYQLDNPERGFSYHGEAPLDMRMDQRERATAKDLVNTLSKQELTDIIKRFGEEKWAQRIAGFIVASREKKGAIKTTSELVDIIKAAIPARARREGPHPARRTFQALRIALNRELDIIPAALTQAAEILRPGGRIAVITFHSLEDRLVKRTFLELQGICKCPPDIPICTCPVGPIKILTRKPLVPDTNELERNPRARSAKLRIAEKRIVLKERAGE